MVLSIFVLSTMPSRTLRSLRGVAVASGIALLLGEVDLALTQDRVETGDVLLDLPDAGVTVELTGHVLEAKVEQLLLRLGEAAEQLGVAQVAKLRCASHHTCSWSWRVTNLALIGSFWMARSMAPRASSSLTPASSNMMRPGFTTATQRSG